MKKINNAAEYAAPECELLETQSEGLLCQSLTGTGISDWERDTEEL